MRILFAIILFCAGIVQGQTSFKMQTPAGEAPGPWLFGTVGVGKGADGKPATTALKGLAVKVGEKGEAAVAYDLDLCRMAGGWTGGKFVTPMNLMSRGEYPTSMGTVSFLSSESAGFPLTAESWRDPRAEPFGPLPELRYRGLFVHGDRVVVRWRAGATEVLESPAFTQRQGMELFTRTFAVATATTPLRIVLCHVPAESVASVTEGVMFFGKGLPGKLVERAGVVQFKDGARTMLATDYGLPEGARWMEIDRQLVVEVPPHVAPLQFRLLLGTLPETVDPLYALTDEPPLEDLTAWCSGGAARWPEPVVTRGEPTAAAAGEPYVVDTIRLPDPNPWNAPVFVGGFDFFPDGRVAVSTFHGDVFIGSGIDQSLEKVTWRRFATGLYHPLGLKVVNGEIYVTGRDGITRLRDLNGDGEADSYEVFNWDVKVTKSFHEFVFDLQTDPAGNFYFAKAGPVKNGGRGFDQICEHHGCLFRVTPDGAKLEVIATGFRAPNGIGVGPYGEITTGDNEGTWTPVCRLNWITPGGFYGVVDLAHRPEPPTDYDRPLCWLPKRVDNSSGSQVWAPAGWGPWGGHLLHLSYGQCALYGVMMEGVQIPDAPDCCSHVMQGGVVKFPLKFESGVMRGRFSPVDGQLYVGGLRGWQTTGVKNGCLQRVRYTGAPVRMPVALSAQKDGVRVQFSASLDTKAACDPENWNVEVWNYLWSAAYGSPEISTLTAAERPAGEFTPAQMKKAQHDPLTIKSITAGTDDRSVFLEIPGMKPVMQMSITYRVKAADGADLSGEIVNTINALQPAEQP